MKEKEDIIEAINYYKDNNKNISEFLEKNIENIFNNADVSQIYLAVKNIELNEDFTNLSKLIIAWLAFLCGDNAKLFKVFSPIEEMSLKTAQESSLFYALKALTKSMLGESEAIKYAKISIDVLPASENSLFMANAKLTYGQLLSGSDKYRLAASMFESSYNIFSSLNLHFLAMVALVNEMLNRVRIGQYKKVIKKSKQTLLINSSANKEIQGFWDVINLPMGICYYDLGQLNLSIKHFLLAKDSIDKIALLHMNGLIELYLFKSYWILGNKQKMKEIKELVEDIFGHMNYEYMDLMMSMFNILYAEYEDISVTEDIERYSLKEVKASMNAHSFVPDVLTYLTIKRDSELIRARDLKPLIEKYKYIGYLSKLQKTYLQIYRLMIKEDNLIDAKEFIKNAIKIYEDCGLCSGFLEVQIGNTETLESENKELYSILTKYISDDQVSVEKLLTPRELDIMQLIALGMTNKQMSKKLFISVGTIKWHINNIFSKLEVDNRILAVKKAKQLKEI